MGSVYVNWNGRCGDAASRRALIARMEELAEISHALFAGPPAIRRFDETIRGNILIAPGLLEGTSVEMPAEVQPAGGLSLRLAGPMGVEKPEAPRDYLRVEAAHLEGIEFRLYDGRGLYPGEDRISFVFAFFEEHAELDGTLVFVEDREQCKLYRDEALQQADYFLTAPNLHLRYYCEEWMDRVLGWVKHFYVPDLYYCRYEPLGGYERWSGVDRGDSAARDLAWRALKDDFLKEVSEGADQAAAVRAFWDAVGRAQS